MFFTENQLLQDIEINCPYWPILKNTLDEGKVMLSYYGSKLAEFIIGRTIRGRNNFVVTKAERQLLAELVCKIFPKENIRNWSNGEQGYIEYNYANMHYRLKHHSVPSASVDIPNRAAQEVASLNAWKMLETKVTPWSEVKDLWSKSFSHRMKQLSNKKFTLHEYFQRLPCLKDARALELFMEDYEQQLVAQKDKNDDFDWEKIIPKLVTTIMQSTLHRKSKRFQSLKEQIRSSNQNADLCAILCLPYLFKITSASGKIIGKFYETKRPTADQSANDFIPHFETSEEANKYEQKMENLCNEIEKEGKIEHIRPLGILIGNLKSNNLLFKIKLLDFVHVFTDPREGIVAFLKLFFAINTPYPPFGKKSFVFMQRTFLQVFDKKNDKCGNDVLNAIDNFDSAAPYQMISEPETQEFHLETSRFEYDSPGITDSQQSDTLESEPDNEYWYNNNQDKSITPENGLEQDFSINIDQQPYRPEFDESYNTYAQQVNPQPFRCEYEYPSEIDQQQSNTSMDQQTYRPEFDYESYNTYAQQANRQPYSHEYEYPSESQPQQYNPIMSSPVCEYSQLFDSFPFIQHFL